MDSKQAMIIKGNWIAKKNGKPFSGTNQKAIKIQKYKHLKLPGEYLINGKFNVIKEHIKEVTLEDAMKMNTNYANMKVSVNRSNGIFSHIREKTGEPKVAYQNAESAMRVLDEMRNKYPEKHFEAYLCSHCNEFHIGTLQDVDIEEPEEIKKMDHNVILFSFVEIVMLIAAYLYFVPEHNIFTISILVLILTLLIWYRIRRLKKIKE